MGKRMVAGAGVVAAVLIGMVLLLVSRTGQQDNPQMDTSPSPLPAKLQQGPVKLQAGQRFNEQIDGLSTRKSNLLRFISGQMTGPYGMYTNRLETDQSQQLTTGHEVLSESASIMQRYLALSGQAETFANTWKQTLATFNREKLFSYRYSPAQQRQYSLNAAVDDLRIIRSLYEAEQAFPDKGYKEEADRFAARLYAVNVKDGHLYDFYDEAYGKTNSFITLCYVDVATLSHFPIESSIRNQLLTDMLDIVTHGYISNLFPFYKTRYNYDSKQYEAESVQTVESMLTILSLAEAGLQRNESIRFIKDQVLSRTLYGAYGLDGTAKNDIQSTAIYAIAAMIGSVTGDKDLYKSSIEAMNQFQITELSSPLFGGFGDPSTGQAYSFDNLLALIAYCY